jgi:hypothetical protein
MNTTTQWNIASATKPHNPEQFMQMVRDAAKSDGFTIDAMAIVPGPGCRNYGIQITGDEANVKRWVESFCIALQPGKYSEVKGDPALRIGEFYYVEE